MELATLELVNDKICYEHVWKSYWLAKYGELTVTIHKDLGYVNATKLCKAHKKQFGHWHRNKNTMAIMDDLAETLTHGGSPVKRSEMMITVEGGSKKHKSTVCGTYVHPILLPHIVSWLDAKYAAVASFLTNNFYGLQTKTGDLASIL